MATKPSVAKPLAQSQLTMALNSRAARPFCSDKFIEDYEPMLIRLYATAQMDEYYSLRDCVAAHRRFLKTNFCICGCGAGNAPPPPSRPAEWVSKAAAKIKHPQ